MSPTAIADADRTLSASFVKLPLGFFRTEHAPSLDLYWQPEDRSRPKLLASSGLGITRDDVLGLQGRGYSSLLVLKSDFDAVTSSLLESLEEIVAEEAMPGEERFAMLQMVVGLEVEKTFHASKCDRFIRLANRVGTQIAQLATREQTTPQLLFKLAQHDTTTFVHTTNVSAYAVMLARALGIGNEKHQEEIAVGAMLHDIGKRCVPKELLTKPGSLTPEERDQIYLHPLRGYEELCDREDLSFGQLMMVYQHHEWVNGDGYPASVLADDIHPWAKLLAVVDVFDALTARRPYRDGIPVDDALCILIDGASKQFDVEAVDCWIKLFHQLSRK